MFAATAETRSRRSNAAVWVKVCRAVAPKFGVQDLGRNLTNSQFPILIDHPRGSASADSKPCWRHRTRARSQTRSCSDENWELRIGQISKSAILDTKLRNSHLTFEKLCPSV